MEKPCRTILLVDDTSEDRELYRAYLKGDPIADYEFVEAELGREALTLCRTQRLDCLLLDQRLPDLDGLECLACLQTQYGVQAPPVILLTGVGSEALAVEAMKRGAQDYLVKGQLTPDALRRAVQHAMAHTELRQALAAQREQTQEREAQLLLALAAAEMGTWSWEVPTNTMTWSEQLAAGFGLPQGITSGTLAYFLALVHPEDRDGVAQKMAHALEDSQSYDMEYRIVRPDGSICWCLSRGSLLRDQHGQPLRLTGIHMDITRRKQMEEGLRSLNATLEQRVEERTSLMEVMQDVTRAANEAKSSVEALQYAVDRLCAYMGWPVGHVYMAVAPGEARWAPTDIWFMDDPERLTAFREATQLVEFAAGEGMIGQVGASGKIVWSVDVAADATFHRYRAAVASGCKTGFALPVLVGPEVAAVLEFYAHKPMVPNPNVIDALMQIGTQLGRAIERERARALEQRQQEALFQREKLAAMGSLLASVAHELNNPLTTIMMQADLLRADVGTGPLAECAEDIMQAASRCERLVRQFLTLARQHVPERVAVDLNALVTDTLELLTHSLRVDTITVDLLLEAALPRLWADPHQLQQVLVNLLTNAQQALHDVATPRRVTLATRVGATPTRVILEVTDTGPGMSPAVQARIFEPFFTTKPSGVGTGLGLPLCRGIIESHGGTIQCTSQPGQGTSFRIELPLGDRPESSQLLAETEALSPMVQHLTILIVDDEPSIARGLVRLLSRDGHSVDTAANGQVALAMLQERPYDLILSDLRMPELDGPGLYQALAQQYPHLCRRFVFLTGDTLRPEGLNAMAQIDVPRLTKPFTVTEVRRLIQQVLRSSG